MPGPIEARADAFVPALLIPAMLAGEPLECDIPVSPRLLASVPRAQAVLAGWYPRFHPVPVAIPAAATVRSQRVERTAAFFSAGVDSFHTLLKNRHGRGTTGTVSHVVFMKGFDAQLAQADGLAESEAHVRGIAGRLGVGLIAGRVQRARPRAQSSGRRRIKVRRWARPDWRSGVALVKSSIPATLTGPRRIPWGPHPLLDECWSSDNVEFVHDGCEARRHEKIAAIGAWDAEAIGELRVCLSAAGGPADAGRCVKCVRTMTVLAPGGYSSARRVSRRRCPTTTRPCSSGTGRISGATFCGHSTLE